jgi:hypothetical protein
VSAALRTGGLSCRSVCGCAAVFLCARGWQTSHHIDGLKADEEGDVAKELCDGVMDDRAEAVSD